MGNTCCGNSMKFEVKDLSQLEKQDEPQNFKKMCQNQQYNTFIQKLNLIRQRILDNISPQKSILTQRKWYEVFQSFNQHYLTLTDRMQLMNFMYKIVKIEFNKQFTSDELKIDFLKEINEPQISLEIGEKLKSLKQRIKYRRSRANEYLAFIKESSSLKMDFSDIDRVAKKVHDFCKKDMNAFSFITLYLINSANAQLNKNPSSLFQIINNLKGVLDKLSMDYPPSSTENDQIQRQKSQNRITYDTPVGYPMIEFSSMDYNIKKKEIKQYMFKKLQQARNDKPTFQKILQPVCLKRGNHFQSSLKIKSIQQGNLLSIVRTIEKILWKQHADKIFNKLKQKQDSIVKNIIKSPEYNKIKLFSSIWYDDLKQVEKGILKEKMQLSFSIGDLLRGRAMFKSNEDIDETVKDIDEALKNWPHQQCSILERDDRLDKPTKDFKMVLMIGDTIAELQLAIETDKKQSEFNHKIYELKRSQSLTPLINLFYVNQSLTEMFFTDQLDFYYHMIKCEDSQFIAYKSELQKFEKNYLAKNVQSFEDQKKGRMVTKKKSTMRAVINEKIEQIDYILSTGYSLEGTYQRDEMRNSNDDNFMK